MTIPYDFHVHCGSERAGSEQLEFVHALEHQGVRFAGLLDHYEFYDGNNHPWFVKFRKNAAEKGFEQYDNSLAGMHALYDQLSDLRTQSPLPFALGLEVRRPETLPEAYLERPEYISNCFHINDAPEDGSFGERAARLIRSFGKLARASGMPGIVNHPFRDCLGPYKDLADKGEAPRPADYFPRADVERMIDAAGEYDVALEVNLRDMNYHAQLGPASKALLIHLHAILVESSLPLSYGSDAHKPDKVGPNDDAEDVLRQIRLETASVQVFAERLRTAAGHR